MSKDTQNVVQEGTVAVSNEALTQASANGVTSALNTVMCAEGVKIGNHSLLDWRDMQCQWDSSKPVGEQGSVSLWSTGTQAGTYTDKNKIEKKVFGYRPVQGGGMMKCQFFANGDQLCKEVATLQGLEEIPSKKASSSTVAQGGIPKS